MTLNGTPGVATAEVARVASAAPLWRRFVAGLVDCVFVLAPIVVALALAGRGTSRTILVALAILASILIAVANDIVLVARTGQSVGRRSLAIQVLDSHSMSPPNFGQVIYRYIVSSALFGIAWHPFGFLPGFVVIVSPWPIICYAPAVVDRRWHRGLNDRAAHTVVIDVLA